MLVPSIFGENVFDDFFDDWTKPSREFPGGPAPHHTAIMKTDIKETDQAFELDIDLPGYKKEDVKLELKDGNLTIAASKDENKEEKDENGKYIRRERFTGSCRRAFYVGKKVTREDVSARFEDGILKVTIAKKQPEPEVEENHFIDIQ